MYASVKSYFLLNIHAMLYLRNSLWAAIHSNNFKQTIKSALLIFLLIGIQNQSIFSQNFGFLGPNVVVQKKSFTGVVIDESDGENKTVPEGTIIETPSGQVTTSEGGKVEMPGINEEGNVFRGGEIVDDKGNTTGSIREKHIESVPSFTDLSKPTISRVQDVIQPGDIMVVEGSGLDKMKKPRLKDESGEKTKLKEIFGSDLQKGLLIPDIPEGVYTFEGEDADGNQISCPTESTYPQLTITGPPIKKKGEKGNITVICSKNNLIAMHVPEGVIRLTPLVGMTKATAPNGLLFHVFEVFGNQPYNIPFEAVEVGEWTATAYTYSHRRVPDIFKGEPVDPISIGEIEYKYDLETNTTTISKKYSFKHQDDDSPASYVNVDYVVSSSEGIDFSTSMTDEYGNSTISKTLPGNITEAFIGPYNVWENVYKKAPPKCEINPVNQEVLYSRGNNDLGQLKKQYKKMDERIKKAKKKTKEKPSYAYETGLIKVTTTTKPKCRCIKKKCKGDIELTVNCEIKIHPSKEIGLPAPDQFALLEGTKSRLPKPAKRYTTTNNPKNKTPGRNVSSQLFHNADLVTSKPGENEIKKVPGSGPPGKLDGIYKTKVSSLIRNSCKPGIYSKRFYFVPKTVYLANGERGRAMFGRLAYIDVVLDIKAGKDPCQLNTTVETYFLEFVRGYAWYKPVKKELPSIIFGAQDTTLNIAKLVKITDGKKVTNFDKHLPREEK